MRLIGLLYQAAVTPAAFEELLEEWDRTLGRAAAGEGAFPDPALDAHLEAARRALETLEAAAPPPLSRTIALDPNPAALLSGAGRVLAMNAAAAGEGLGPALAAAAPGALARAREGAGAGAAGGGGVIGLVEVEAGGVRRLFALSPVASAAEPEAAALLSAVAPVWSAATLAAIRAHYDLTEAETEVVTALASGRSVAAIAAGRGRSVHTVRTQVKAILGKTGCESQIDLVRRMGFLQRFEPAAGGAEAAPGGGARVGAQGGAGTRAGAPALPHLEIGPADGRPVLFVHGLIDAPRVTAETERLLRAMGLRLIAPIRPGFGAAGAEGGAETRAEVGTGGDRPGAFADAAAALLDRLGLGRVPVIGHMAGALYAFALAARHPGRVAALLSVAGAAPMTEDWPFAGMSPGHRIAAVTARRAPAALPLLVGSGVRLLRAGREERMLRLYLRDSPVDAALARDPEVAALLRARFRFATAQGGRAFEADIAEVTRDWSALAAGVRAPVTIVHGRHDRAVPAPAAEAFAARLPGARLVIAEGAGQLVLTAEPGRVLGLVA